MSDKKSSREIDRLFEVVSQISTVKTKIEEFFKRYESDLGTLKSTYDECVRDIRETLKNIGEKTGKLSEKDNFLEKKIDDLSHSVTQWKWIFGAVSFIVSPLVTTLIIMWLHSALGF